ncbi:MAG: thioesterase family protein [Myxococcota bacterium]|nr:thioesterase family protein [Myxococcota bacterium]
MTTPDTWPIQCELPVQWGDMDALGHVNHTIYIKWMETARMHYFHACGFGESYTTEGIGPILAAIEVDYIRPVVFGETIRVETRMSRIGRASFDMEYRLTSVSESPEQVATGIAKCVVYNYNTAKPTPMDEPLRAAIEALEATGAVSADS